MPLDASRTSCTYQLSLFLATYILHIHDVISLLPPLISEVTDPALFFKILTMPTGFHIKS